MPADILEKTETSIRAAGREGCELFVLWSGRGNGATFRVRSAHVPRQTAYRTEEGLLIRIDGDALHQLNAWLYENDEELAVQVHAHPGTAFHSDTDDSFPVATTVGSLSIVAAEFCRHGLIDETTAAFRLTKRGWSESAAPVTELLCVV